MADFERKVVEIIRNNKCQRPGCKSGNQDNLQVAWFGSKFDTKELTCSSCVLRNDQVLSRLQPVALNLMPISGFVHKFIEEYTQYNKVKASKDWIPKKDQIKKKEIIIKLDTFQKKLTQTLKQLLQTLENFGKLVAQKSGQIFTVGEFEQILKMQQENNFSKLFSQIQIVMKRIHKIGQNSFKFISEADRNTKNARVKLAIADVSKRTTNVLSNLCTQIRDKTEQIHKV